MVDYINLKKLTIEELAGVVSIYPWFGVARKELCIRMFRAGGKDWGISQYADAAMYMGSRRILSDLLRSANQTDYSDTDMGEVVKTAFAFVDDKGKDDVSESEHQEISQETSQEASQETSPEAVPQEVSLEDSPREVSSEEVSKDVSKDVSKEVHREDSQGREVKDSKPETIIRVVGGDYFTKGEYENAKRGGDDVFANFKTNLGDSEQEIENSRKKAMKSTGKPSVNDFYTETLAQVYAEQGYFEEAIRIYNKLILANPKKNTYFANLIDNLENEINN